MSEPTAEVRQLRTVAYPRSNVAIARAAWIPATPRAIVVIAHGHAEHLGRYSMLVNGFVAAGYAVYGQDHRGHGRSSGPRALLMRFDDTVDDLHRLVRDAKAAHPGLPCVLFGHSMGGLIAVRYALAHQDELDALIVTGPALIIADEMPERQRRIAGVLARLAPAGPLPRGRGNTLTKDPETGERFPDDHRNHRGPTRLRTAWGMLTGGEDALARAASLTLPLLAMHGEDDRLTFPEGTKTLHERVASLDKTLRIWPGMLHEILNETDRHAVLTEILAWLDQRMPAAT